MVTYGAIYSVLLFAGSHFAVVEHASHIVVKCQQFLVQRLRQDVHIVLNVRAFLSSVLI